MGGKGRVAMTGGYLSIHELNDLGLLQLLLWHTHY
jgi:hypothetical protein